ncbi:MAG: UDP-glucose/GDP-mannose dehydrogenase family protein [Euryarchaeota archaeon]|nr:UDP-glucose/GDP-mannose dehydrogenase family protein [Euryarchaeota archaeon]
MKIAVVGTGYVGLTTALLFAELGHDVIAIDVDEEKVKMLNSGKVPIYEPGADELLAKHAGKNLRASTEYEIEDRDVVFICVGTPSRKDGSMETRYLEAAAEEIGKRLKKNMIVVVKSTVVPGTTENLVIPILERESGMKRGEFGVAMNPEFLREGLAIYDTFHPDRVVIGELDKRTGDVLEELYRPLEAPILRVKIKVAEMIKYTSNAFLAMKISFANEIANICERIGIDVYDVMKGVGMDKRISPQFLNAGAGFGGSCFPKDVSALVDFSRTLNYQAKLLEDVLKINDYQPRHLVELAEKHYGSLNGARVAVLGLAFKPETDDIRETRAAIIVEELLKRGAEVVGYDPKAMDNFKKLYPDIEYAPSAEEALKNADIAIIQTAWDEFKNIDYDSFDNLKLVVDGRRTAKPKKVKYVAIGRGD